MFEFKILICNDKEVVELKLICEKLVEFEIKVELLEKEKGFILENSIKEIIE